MFGGTVSVNVGPVAAAGPVLVTVCVQVTLPTAATEVGAAELVATRLACAPPATTSFAIAELLFGLGSVVDELTVAISLIWVPDMIPAFTFTMYVMVAGAPGSRLASVHVRVKVEQIQPAGPVSDTTVVFAGKASFRVTLVAVDGPAL